MSSSEAAPRSLHGRLALSLLIGTVTVLGIVFFALHLVIRGAMYDHLESELVLRMRAVASYAVAHPGKESIAEFMPRFRTRAHQDFFQVWDSSGRTLARSDSSSGRDLPRLDAQAGSPTYHELTLPDGHRGRAVTEIFPLPEGDTRGVLHIVTAEETERLDALEQSIHFMLLIGALAAILATLLTARRSVMHALQPVDDFSASVAHVQLDDPVARLQTAALPSELQPIANSFTTLLDRLLGALAREKRYARNVAHELRNPLAEMRLLAEAAAAARNPDKAHAAILEIQESTGELEKVVDSLLALTRYEAGIESPQPEPVDLCQNLRRQVESVRGRAEQRQLQIELELPAECWVYTDSTLAGRLFSNLLGNAMAHAPHGTTVRVCAAPNGDVEIANAAPLLTAADMPRLGERFYRVAVEGAENGHAGLGLSLATAMARVLGVNLAFTLRDDGWLVVKLSGFQALRGSAQ